MSIRLPESTLSPELRRRVAKDLEFEPNPSRFQLSLPHAARPEPVCAYHFCEGGGLNVPFHYGANSLELRRPPRGRFEQLDLGFEGELRPLQVEVRKEVLRRLNKTGSCILSLMCGGGKTATAINVATLVRLPTLVIMNRLVLIKQWEESIRKFCPSARVQKLTAKSKVAPADFYLMNAINVPKLGEGALSGVGFLVADEVHLIGTEKLTNSLFYVQPRYALGLSATPTRPDGMEKLLHAFFGSVPIHRKLFRKHLVHRVDTGLTPPRVLTALGKLDWNSVLEFQAESEERNAIIVEIIVGRPESNFLVLCKRVAHTRKILDALAARGIVGESLVGAKKTFDSTARVLVATVQKAGVGFDHPRLNALIVAADMQEYFLQYLGRVFRVPDQIPVVYDLVDNSHTLKKHFRTRRRVYLEHGGEIRPYRSGSSESGGGAEPVRPRLL